MADSPWLRDAVRFALHATASTEVSWPADNDISIAGGGDLVDPDDPGKDPRFRKLVEAILYSRRFLKTYNLVLLVILLVFTIWHWTDKLLLRREMRKQSGATSSISRTRSNDPEAWSSSSSTLSGSASPPTPTHLPKPTTESTPLIPSARRTPSTLWAPYSILKSTLAYQPPPLPLINKTLPTNSTSLLVVSWLALILFYNLHLMPLNFYYLFVFADRCGIIFISNLPLLYLLGAKNQPLKKLTGYSYESVNILHRRVGEVICLEAFLHFAGMWAVWYGMLRHLGFTLSKFLFNRVVLLGLAAFVAYEVIYFSSLGSFRKKWYEVFLATHVVLQVLGLVFLWFHHYTSRPYVGVSLAIWAVDRLVYRLWARKSTHTADLGIMDDGETVVVSANWDVVEKKRWMGSNMETGWAPNQHVFISVPELGKTHGLQSHPFTIFSAAPTSEHAWLALLIRAQSPGGFSYALLQHAHTHSTIPIRLDGPYGSSHALDMLCSSPTAILVAGGSGIAVAYPLLYALLSSSPRRTRNVKLLWITHAPDHRTWVPESKMKELEDWGLDVLIPPPTAIAGRPDVRDVLTGWVEENDGGAGVVVSGPEGLVRDVRNVCAGMVWRGKDVSVQVEKFGW